MKLTALTDNFFVNYPDSVLLALEAVSPGLTITCMPRTSATIVNLMDSEAIFGWVSPRLLKDLPNLKWLHLPNSGANNYANPALYANPSVILTKSSGTFGIPISEYVLGMMVALSRNFTRHYKNQQEGNWPRDYLETLDIFGSNVFVLGLGDVGTEVCKRLSGFGCHITGFRRDTSVPHEFANEVRPISLLRESLPDADYIIFCLPGTNETYQLIGREEFGLMKKRAIVINIGRGSLIDTDALVDALNNHQIAGAGVDVTDPEPLPAEHPLWSAENVIITPHSSAMSPGNDARRLEIFTDLLKRYTSEQELYNIVDFALGY